MRLTVEGLAADRGAGPIFENIGFSLTDGEGLLVTGPNGAGKSTLIRVIAGLLHPAAGSVSLEDPNNIYPDVAAAAHYLGPLNAMKASLSVRENLAFWQQFHGKPDMTVFEAMETVGLPHAIDLPFAYLSTGQRRRAAIARLLLNRRPVWLLDEPTSGLDKASEEYFAGLATDHLDNGGIVVAATHLPIPVKGMKRLEFGAAVAA